LRGDETIPREDEHHAANEAAGTVGGLAHGFEEEGVALCIAQFLPAFRAETGRVYAGRPAQGVDGDARIIGQDRALPTAGQGTGLDEGVLEEIIPGLVGRKVDAPLKRTAYAVSGKEGANLGKLVRIGAGKENFHVKTISVLLDMGQASLAKPEVMQTRIDRALRDSQHLGYLGVTGGVVVTLDTRESLG
jgi:hypothetical protein